MYLGSRRSHEIGVETLCFGVAGAASQLSLIERAVWACPQGSFVDGRGLWREVLVVPTSAVMVDMPSQPVVSRVEAVDFESVCHLNLHLKPHLLH